MFLTKGYINTSRYNNCNINVETFTQYYGFVEILLTSS